MSKTDAILQAIMDAGPQGASQQDLNALAYRYGSAIHRLRKQGHRITTIRMEGSDACFRFVYEGKAEPAETLDNNTMEGVGVEV